MKIGQSPEPSSGVPAPAAKRPEAEAAAQARGAAQQPTQASSVSVSTLTRSMEARRASDAADIDQVKVEQIRASIKDGSYVVDAEAIADKMLADARDMLKPRDATS